jgi:hypothetical protein
MPRISSCSKLGAAGRAAAADGFVKILPVRFAQAYRIAPPAAAD